MLKFPLQETVTEGGEGGGGGDDGGGAGDDFTYPVLQERPQFIPEKFWNGQGQTMAELTEALAGSYGQLETAYYKKTEDLRDQVRNEVEATLRPELDKSIRAELETDEYKEKLREGWETERREGLPDSPAGYTLTTENLEIPDSIELELPDDDPLVQFWQQTAHENGLSQKQFEAGIQAWLNQEIAGLPDPEATLAEIGENAKDRLQLVETKLKAVLPAAELEGLKEITVNANAFKAVERLLNGSAALPLGDGGGGGGGGEDELDEEGIRKLMATEAYQKNDPEMHKRVREAWERLTAREGG